MSHKINAAKIEEARRNKKRNQPDTKTTVQEEIKDALARNRAGKRKVTVLEPAKSKKKAKVDIQRVAAYCRVSTQEDEQQNSFEMQKLHFERVIRDTPEYVKAGIYTDKGISGTSTKNRDGFNQLMDDCRAGKIDLILTKSISRFGRNIIDVLSSLEELSELNPPVTVFFETEGLGTADGKNSLIITILSALAEMESQQKSEAVKAGIRYRMQEGLYKFGLSNTLGYYRDYTGRVKIESSEADIVKYIYDSFLEGATFSSIAESLEKMDIVSPTGKSKWRHETVKSILTNEKYCGNVLYQKTYVKNFKKHVSIKNRDVLTKWLWEDMHPAIIPVDKWNKVQELIRNYNPQQRKVGARVVNLLPTFFRIKSGQLRGYYVIDMSWNKELRNSFIELITNSK